LHGDVLPVFSAACRPAWCGRQAEGHGRHRSLGDFLVHGNAHITHLQRQAQGQAGQRVVAVQHHVLVVHLGDGVDGFTRKVRRGGAFGRAIELHARAHALGEQFAGLEEHQVGVVLAKRVFRLQVQLGFEAGGLPHQGFFHLGQQVFAAHQKFHGRFKFVDELSLCVFQSPGQAHHAG